MSNSNELNLSANSSTAASAASEVVFVDARVLDSTELLAGISPDAQVVYLDAGSDGLAQMADYLSAHPGASAVHVLAHGSQGNLWLGSSFLDFAALGDHSADLARIGQSLTADGDILVYSCDLAAGGTGATFVDTLAALTGADVAASTNHTGAGGDWQLEITTGSVEADLPLAQQATEAYDLSLATLTVTTNTDQAAGASLAADISDGGGLSIREAIAWAAASGDTVTFQSGVTNSVLSLGELVIAKSVTIDGDLDNNGTADVTLNANSSSRVISISTGYSVSLDGLIITGGLVSGNGAGSGNANAGGFAQGGGISNAGTLTLNNVNVTQNAATGGGGGGGVIGGSVGGGGGGGSGANGIGGGSGGNAGGGGGEYSGVAGGSGNGGRGGGYRTDEGFMGGRGGTSAGGGAGGLGLYGYSTGGAGASATASGVTIGGGGGGTGWDGNGGSGGAAAGAIYNSGTLTIIGNSAITNNIAAGGGGGGGGGSGNHAGVGGQGVGAIWNQGGTVNITAANFSAMSGNAGSSGTIGSVVSSGSNSGFSSPAAVNNIYNNGGTLDTSYVPPDVTPPTVTSVNSSTLDGSYKIGDAISIQVNFSESVTVTGTPQLTLETGTTDRVVNYASGTGTTALTFTYTVQAGDTAADLDYQGTTALALNGGTIKDAAGNNGTLTLAAPGAANSLGNDKALVIDGVAPTATIATATFSADTGSSSTDFNTKTAAQTISGTTSANMVAGEIVEVSIDNGSTWSTANTSVGANTWSLAATLTASDTLQVRVSDTAGNSGTVASQAYVLDTTTPTATIATIAFSADTGSSGTDFNTKTAAQTISGTTSANMVAGEIVEVSIDNGSTWSTATTSVGANTWSLAATLTASDTLKVRVSDTAGNSGTVASQAYVLDTTAPTATIATTAFSADTGSSSTDFNTQTAAQTISGTTSANMVAGEIVEVSIDNGSTWSTATTSVGANTWTINKTLTASNTLQVRVSDTAGNSSAATTQAYVLDTTAPTTTIATKSFSADTGSSGTDFITNTAAQTISGTTSANLVSGEIVEVSIDNGSTWSTATTSVGANTWTINKTLTASDTLQVRVSDTAGNSSAATTQAYVLDTTAPTTTIATKAFSADTGSSGADFITNTAAQTISGTTSANLVSGEIVEVSIDNGSTWSTATTSVGANTWTINKTLTASDTLQVRVSDTAGNSSAATTQAYVLDTTAPTTTIATKTFSADTGSSGADFITNTAAQTISGTTSANLVSGEIVEVSIDNGSTWSTATTSVGASTWTINKTLTGSNTLQVRVSDTAGNSSAASTQAYVLDASAPAAPSAPDLASASDSGSSSTDDITNVTTGTYTGTAEAGATVTLYDTDGTTSLGTATATGGNWSITSSALSQGTHTLTAKATDTAGNVSSASSSLSVTVDTTAPTTTIATKTFSADTGSSGADFITNTAAQTLSGTTSANMVAGEIVEVSIDNGSTWSTATTSVGANTWSLATTLTGSDTLKVRVSDTAGNSGTAASQVYVLDTTAPTATIATTAFSADTGSSGTDFITHTAAQTLSGTTSANMVASEIVEVSIDNGASWSTAITSVGANTWSLATTLTASDTLKVRVSDTAGNSGTVASQAYVLDTLAPVLASAAIDGNTLVLTYAEFSTLDALDIAPASAFAVVSGGSANGVTAVLVNAAAKTVSLTLAGSVAYGHVVTVAYTDPTGTDDVNATQDAAGNDAASFVATPVTNNTSAPPDPLNTPGSGLTISASDTQAPIMGMVLTVNAQALVDPDGLGATSLQWLRDGNPVAGATGTSYTLGLDDVGALISVTASYVDGLHHAEVVTAALTVRVGGSDNLPAEMEARAPALLPGGLVGDGNGDGKLDEWQANVSSFEVARPPGQGGTTFMTLVTDSDSGIEDTADTNRSYFTQIEINTSPLVPAVLKLPALISFTSALDGPGASETFSLFVDPSVGANGFWVQDSSGVWNNIATAIETVGGKVRIDFTVVDGGPFDSDGVANGVIECTGGAGELPLRLVGLVPDAGHGGFWF